MPQLNTSILESYFKGAEISVIPNANDKLDTFYDVYLNNEKIVRFKMDKQIIGIIKYDCYNQDYLKLCKKIFLQHKHHEFNEKVGRIQQKNKKAKNITSVQVLTSNKSTNQKTEQEDDKYSFIYVRKDKNEIYLLSHGTYLLFSMNKMPNNLKMFLENNKNYLVAYNTAEIYSFFSSTDIKINCYYDIQLYLLVNGQAAPNTSSFIKENKLTKTKPKAILEHISKVFHQLKACMPQDASNILFKQLLPYNRFMCNIINNPPKIDKDGLVKAISDGQINEKAISKHIPLENKFFMEDMSKTISYRYCTKNKNFQGMPTKNKDILKAAEYIVPHNDNSIFVDIDLSYADLVSLATLSNCPTLCNAIKNNIDIYLLVRDMIVSELKENSISSINITRSDSKSILLPYINGQSKENIKNTIISLCKLDVPNSDAIAEKILKRLKTELSEVEKYRKMIYSSAYKNKYIKTINGLKTPIDNGNSIYTTSINRMNQSTTSFTVISLTLNIAKIAKEKHVPFQLIMQRHDELIFEVHKNYKRKFINIIKEATSHSDVTNLPIPHSLLVGKNYYELLIEKSENDYIDHLMNCLERNLIRLVKETNCTDATFDIDTKYEDKYIDFLKTNEITILSIKSISTNKKQLHLTWK